jgi:hypothetical protein
LNERLPWLALRVGQVASEPPLVRTGKARIPGSTVMGGLGEKLNAPDGCSPKLTVAVPVPALSIGSANPLCESAG